MFKRLTFKGGIALLVLALLSGMLPGIGSKLLGPIEAYADPAAFGQLAGTDELGRTLPTYGQVPAPRSNRYVGMFYFLWAGQHGTGGPYDITKIRQQDPSAVNNASNPLWGPVEAFHHWGESQMGYYFSTDAWVLRKHMQLLTDAGVDFLVFDTTNGFPYKNVYDVLLPIMEDLRVQGFNVPKIVFYTNSNSGSTITSIYNDIYANNRYPNLWFNWKGKPLIIGNPGETSATIQNFFTFRLPQWPNEAQKTNGFPWIEFQRPQKVYFNNLGEKESASVSVAQHPSVVMSDTPFYGYGGNWGRSFHNGANDTTPGAVNYGYNVKEQWDNAINQDPMIIHVTGWNEWMAMRFNGPAGRPVQFIDQATLDFSRDIEPMKDGYKDNYYMQLVDEIRRYKGMGPQLAPSAKKTITMNADFTQWNAVTPVYRDYVGDTVSRNSPGYGTLTYSNSTGRNDFDTLKVARDDNNLYFYAKTAANITAYTDSKWMRLFLNTDGNNTNGWNGYDYVLNRTGATSATATLEQSTGGWNWQTVGTVDYRVSGNQFHVSIPRSYVQLTSTSTPLNIQFKWSDNMQTDGDATDFYVNGDAAPGARFSYVYAEDVSPAAPFPVNVAGGKSTSASSAIAGWPSSNLTDLNFGTPYSSGNSLTTNHAEWVKVDLGSNYSLSKVELWPRGDGANTGYGFPVNFTLQVSTDNTNWTTVSTHTGFGKPGYDVQGFTFAPTTGRYVKLDATSLRSNPNESNYYRLQLNEMLAYGAPYSGAVDTNVALNKMATSSSSVEGSGWGLTALNDGNNTNGYSSNNSLAANHTEWVKIDLGSNQTVNRVDLWPRGDGANTGYGFPVNFTIALSTDNANWTTVSTQTGFGKPGFAVQNFPFTAQSARYVRIEATSLRSNPNESNYYRLQFSDVGVNSASPSTSYIYSWPFASTVESWTATNQITGFAWQSGGYAGGTITGSDPNISSAANLGIPITSNKKLKIRLKNTTSSTTAQVYFITDADGTWNEAKHKDFTIVANDSGYTEYTVDMASVAGWTGTLNRLRIDPASGTGSFGFDFVGITS